MIKELQFNCSSVPSLYWLTDNVLLVQNADIWRSVIWKIMYLLWSVGMSLIIVNRGYIMFSSGPFKTINVLVLSLISPLEGR